jgi:hypothetical protein
MIKFQENRDFVRLRLFPQFLECARIDELVESIKKQFYVQKISCIVEAEDDIITIYL